MSEIIKVEADAVLKIKEFTIVNDCFQYKSNEEIGVFWRALNKSNSVKYICQMSEELNININLGKEEKYKQLLPQLTALLNDEEDMVAKQANFCAALKYGMDFFWVGFYKVQGNELMLGPFQGPVACTRISKGKGVCGTAWENEQTIIVGDVDLFPGHIACSSLSKSEIVVPVFDASGKVALVLDVDATEVNIFDEIDKKYLERLVRLIY